MQNLVIFKNSFGNNSSVYKDALKIRNEVFVQEQQVPVSEEIDKFDEIAEHFVGYFRNNPICCARVFEKEGRYYFGRIAVLKKYRKQQIGEQLLKKLLDDVLSTSKTNKIYLYSQAQVINFYEKLGFVKIGDAFLDANIVHYPMFYHL